jgi:hypothetical protein
MSPRSCRRSRRCRACRSAWQDWSTARSGDHRYPPRGTGQEPGRPLGSRRRTRQIDRCPSGCRHSRRCRACRSALRGWSTARSVDRTRRRRGTDPAPRRPPGCLPRTRQIDRCPFGCRRSHRRRTCRQAWEDWSTSRYLDHRYPPRGTGQEVGRPLGSRRRTRQIDRCPSGCRRSRRCRTGRSGWGRVHRRQ